MAMIRKQLLITEHQDRQIKALAAATARSEGDLVREAVEDWLAKQRAEQEDWKAGLRKLRGMWKDRNDLDQLDQERRRRRRIRRARINKLMATGKAE